MSGMFFIFCALAIVFAGILWAMVRNIRAADGFRRQLHQRLHTLRMFRALQLFGIDTGRYVYVEPAVDIENRLRKCAGCEEIQRCEKHLERCRPVNEFDFCPNYGALCALRERLPMQSE